MATKSVLTTVEGPNGKADLYEVEGGAAHLEIEYVVAFNGKEYKFATMGEAYIEAGALAGTAT
jgi:hypothetical protein